MTKAEFIKVFELTLVSANLDIISLSLVDDSHVLITFKGNGTRKVNIEGGQLWCNYPRYNEVCILSVKSL